MRPLIFLRKLVLLLIFNLAVINSAHAVWETEYYDLLGVEPTASQETIEKAFKKLAIKYHPDRNAGNTEALAKFQEFSGAYDVLRKPDERGSYDRYGKYYKTGPLRKEIDDLKKIGITTKRAADAYAASKKAGANPSQPKPAAEKPAGPKPAEAKPSQAKPEQAKTAQAKPAGKWDPFAGFRQATAEEMARTHSSAPGSSSKPSSQPGPYAKESKIYPPPPQPPPPKEEPKPQPQANERAQAKPEPQTQASQQPKENPHPAPEPPKSQGWLDRSKIYGSQTDLALAGARSGYAPRPNCAMGAFVNLKDN